MYSMLDTFNIQKVFNRLSIWEIYSHIYPLGWMLLVGRIANLKQNMKIQNYKNAPVKMRPLSSSSNKSSNLSPVVKFVCSFYHVVICMVLDNIVTIIIIWMCNSTHNCGGLISCTCSCFEHTYIFFLSEFRLSVTWASRSHLLYYWRRRYIRLRENLLVVSRRHNNCKALNLRIFPSMLLQLKPSSFSISCRSYKWKFGRIWCFNALC